MITRIFRNLIDLSPRFSRWGWRVFYEFLAMLSKKMITWKYMNYGYAEPGTTHFDNLDVCSENLYQHLFNFTDLTGKHSLEVGCGRGGGCELMLQSGPAKVSGLDFSETAIRFCKKQYKNNPKLEFFQGDAEKQPFENNSFDVVLNVESSHCYGNRDQFFAEVFRVLKPGGVFLYADFMGRVHFPVRERKLGEAGFEIAVQEDITENVFRSMQLSAPLKAALVNKKVPKPVRKAFNDFTGAPGSNIFNYFEGREGIYFAMLCAKPQA